MPMQGIEGYGWGALSVHLLIRHLLGLHEEEAGVIKIAPILPQVLHRVGATYCVGPVPWGKYLLYMVYAVRDAGSYSMQVRYVVRTVLEALQEVVEQKWA